MQALTMQQSITQELNPDLFLSFVEWLDRCQKTSRSYLTNLKQFAAWLHYEGISRPTREDIIHYRQWLCTEHEGIKLDSVTGWTYRTDSTGRPVKITCRPNTVNQYLRSVKQFFAWTAANGIYPDIAANVHGPKIRHDTHRKDALTAAEVLAIETSIEAQAAAQEQAAADAYKDKAGKMQRSTEQGKRLYAMYVLTVNAGLRTIEISRANVEDLVIKGGQAWLMIWGKGHSEPDQKKAIAPQVAQAIKDYLQARTDRPTGTSPLFVATGNRSGGKRLDPCTISKMLKQAMRAAGFDSTTITAHSLRHSTGTSIMQLTGNNIFEAQKYMRHTDPKTTEIYIHEGEQEETRAAALAQALYNLYHRRVPG